MLELGNIIKGHINEALGANEDLSKQRLLICHTCPLYSDKLGGMCNNRLWMNPKTEDVSTYYKDGYIRGCGCRTNPKTRLLNAKCPLNKW